MPRPSPVKPDQSSTPANCPICGKSMPTPTEHAPFCSSRCRKVDLNRWFNEDYKFSRPIEQSDLDEGE